MAGITAGAAALVSAGIGVVGNIVGGIFGNSKAKRQAKAAQEERNRINREITLFENNRQDVINPYSDVKSLAGFAKDLSGELANPYANLGVATSAAEIKMEQTDLALAATLDTLQATGASAGGATALANAAARSKKDVAANIEQQEAQNEKLKAQGKQNLMNAKMAEQQRMQSVAISEGQRVQAAEAAGQQFMFQAEENRTNMDLDRAASQISQAQAAEASANQAKAQAWSSALGGVTSVVGAGIGSGELG